MQPIQRSTPIKPLHILASLILLWGIATPGVYAQEPATEAPPVPTVTIESSSLSSETPLHPSRDMRDRTLYARAIGDQAQWLDTEYGKVLALYRPTEAKKTEGVLVLFHAAEDPEFWPPILENLRANLPRYGWETLAMTLPQQYPLPVPIRHSSSSTSTLNNQEEAEPETTQTKPDTGSASSTDNSTPNQSSSSAVARTTLIQAYVDATFKFLQDKGQFNAVLLVDNSSAPPVLQQLLPQIRQNPGDPETIDGPLQAVVITNLQSQELLDTSELSALFTNKDLPVLDVFFSPDDAEQRKARDLHRAVAMRQKLENYYQALLDNQPKMVESDPRSFLTARVRGFMDRHASGTETKAEKENSKENTAP